MNEEFDEPCEICNGRKMSHIRCNETYMAKVRAENKKTNE